MSIKHDMISKHLAVPIISPNNNFAFYDELQKNND